MKFQGLRKGVHYIYYSHVFNTTFLYYFNRTNDIKRFLPCRLSVQYGLKHHKLYYPPEPQWQALEPHWLALELPQHASGPHHWYEASLLYECLQCHYKFNQNIEKTLKKSILKEKKRKWQSYKYLLWVLSLINRAKVN